MKLIRNVYFLVLLKTVAIAQTVVVPGGAIGNSNSGNTGIGTTTPNQKLSLNGGLGFSNQNDLDKKLYSPADGLLQWMTHNFAGSHAFEISHQGVTVYTHLDTIGTSYIAANGGGNVGIGTVSPSAKLHIHGGSLGTAAGSTNTLVTLQTTNVNQSFLKVLQLRNSTGAFWDTTTTKILHVTDTSPQGYIDFNPPDGAWGMAFGSQGSEYVRIQNGGNVGIGTTNPTQKLSVNGTIRAKEVIVETTGWSDYVLDKGYPLQSLSSVEEQIERDGHLPGIPSARDVAENGISLGEMQAKLLAKIEELTLHQIEQERLIRVQGEKIAALQTQLAGTVGSGSRVTAGTN